MFWVLPSGLAAGLASFLATILPAIFADFRAKLSAGQWQAVWQAKMANELFSAHGMIKRASQIPKRREWENSQVSEQAPAAVYFA